MQKHFLYTLIQTQLFDNIMVIAWVCRVGAGGGHDVSDLRQVAAPLVQRFPTSCHGQLDAMVKKHITQLSYRRRLGSIGDGMIDVSNGRTRVNAGILIDCQHFVEPVKAPVSTGAKQSAISNPTLENWDRIVLREWSAVRA